MSLRTIPKLTLSLDHTYAHFDLPKAETRRVWTHGYSEDREKECSSINYSLLSNLAIQLKERMTYEGVFTGKEVVVTITVPGIILLLISYAS